MCELSIFLHCVILLNFIVNPSNMMKPTEILGEIKNQKFHAICYPYKICIQWNINQEQEYETFEDKTLNTVINRIWEYDDGLLFVFENNLYHIDKLGQKKVIVYNITPGSTHISKNNSKILILEDASDPPDDLFIIPIKDAINVSVDMDDDADRKKYHIISFCTRYAVITLIRSMMIMCIVWKIMIDFISLIYK